MTKISIIGAGYVGSTTAFSLLKESIASEITLVDINKEKLEGEALDLANGLVYSNTSKITYSTKYNITKNSDIIIITAGANQKPGETRLDLTKKNVKIIKEIVKNTEKYNKNSIYIIVSNPVDILTYHVKKMIKNSKQRVLGTGTSLDTARIRYYISEKLKVNTKNVHAYILGEHGDSSFFVESTANISGRPLKELCTKKEIEECYKKTKNSAYEIINKKGATYYAIALTITNIVRTIINDEKTIMPVSTIPIEYNIKDVSLSVPCIIGRKGIEKIFKINLNSKEKKLLEKSRRILKKYI